MGLGEERRVLVHVWIVIRLVSQGTAVYNVIPYRLVPAPQLGTASSSATMLSAIVLKLVKRCMCRLGLLDDGRV